MAPTRSILPLRNIESMCLDEPLLDPAHFDDEDHESVRLAIDLLEALRRGVPPCASTVVWFDNALTRFATGEAKDWTAAFEMPNSTRKPLRHRTQTGHLRDALALVHCEKSGPKARAEALADEIGRFEVRYGTEMPAQPLPEWSRLRRCVWRARQFGKLPQTWERIAKRLER